MRFNFAFCDSVYSAYLLAVDASGDRAAVVYSFQGSAGEVRTRARWQQIKFTRSGCPFVTFRGRRLSLDLFMRVNF